MTIESLVNKIHDNEGLIASNDGICAILNRSNNLVGYDYLNRIILYIQYKNAFDVRTAEQWELDGFNVKKDSKPLYIVKAKYKSKYIRTKTGDIIDDLDLTPIEINSAIKYGIIHKENCIDKVETSCVFDIRQLNLDKDYKDKINRKLSKKDVINVFKGITGYTVVESEENYVSKSRKQLFIKKGTYKEIVITIANELSTFFIENSNISIDNVDKKFLHKALIYSIETLFLVDNPTSFIDEANNDTYKILEVFNIVDAYMYEINKILYNNNIINNIDSNAESDYINKVNLILNIMESNIINNKMKG